MTLSSARRLARKVAAGYHVILGQNLVGFYLHGSMTLGGFNDGSDIDFLVVTNAGPPQDQKERMIRLLLDLDGQAPEKGFEMSAVTLNDTQNPVYPPHFSLHFSNTHKDRAAADIAGYCRDMNGRDPDLAAHFTVARLFGEALIGPPPKAVFAPVPRRDYIAAVISDISGAPEDIIKNPVYVVLNLCRVTAACEQDLVLSKKDGGRWGLVNFPDKYRPLIQDALDSYLNGSRYVSSRISEAARRDFAEYSMKRLGPYIT